MVCVMKEEKDIDNEAEERMREYNTKIAYKNGILEGIKRYSWLEDGIRYVGTAKKTLDAAIQEIEEEYKCLEP
jgi:cell fate regulator YaaT (PSP1 superfamily)